MNRTIKTLILFVLFGTCISWMNCGNDDNPLTPSSLAGTWELVTFTDKTTNVTANAGEATDIGEGATMTVTGSLVLTETRYTFTLSITISMSGLPPDTETMTSTGTYSIGGSTLTIVEDGTGETNTATISISRGRLTLEDDEVKLVFEKQ
ncbi:MAG: lipocalin family protein [bacterium]